jgi:hypothetical protein
LLKMVLSNCAIDNVSLYPSHRKPFDLIFERAKREESCAPRDSNSRPIAPEHLPHETINSFGYCGSFVWFAFHVSERLCMQVIQRLLNSY